MFNRIIVPTDGSDTAWRAVKVGDRLAVECDADLELLHVVVVPVEAERDEHHFRQRLDDHPLRSGAPLVTVKPVDHTVATTIVDHLASVDRGLLVMSSIGRGRSEAILGSVTTDVLTEMIAPVVVVGPHADVDREDLRGELVVPVDGSSLSEAALDPAAAWGIALGARPWVVTVADPDAPQPADLFETAYPSRLAHRLASLSEHPVEFEVLHDRHPDRAIAEFAKSIGASLIVATTHGRTGLARLALGSVAAAIVRHAPCPVVLRRPPGMEPPARRHRHAKEPSDSDA